MAFQVTYEIVTQASAEHGDAAERGFLDSNGNTVQALCGKPTPGIDMPFRQAFDLFQRERDWSGVEADSYPISRDYPPRWFTDSGEIQWASGDCRSVSIHLPENITPSSAMRIARLVNCYGATE